MVVQTPCDRQCGTVFVEIWFLVMGGRVDIAVLLRRSRDDYLLSSNRHRDDGCMLVLTR